MASIKDKIRAQNADIIWDTQQTSTANPTIKDKIRAQNESITQPEPTPTTRPSVRQEITERNAAEPATSEPKKTPEPRETPPVVQTSTQPSQNTVRDSNLEWDRDIRNEIFTRNRLKGATTGAEVIKGVYSGYIGQDEIDLIQRDNPELFQDMLDAQNDAAALASINWDPRGTYDESGDLLAQMKKNNEDAIKRMQTIADNKISSEEIYNKYLDTPELTDKLDKYNVLQKEIIELRNIMKQTEDDIREEKGGQASESYIRALTSNRNKDIQRQIDMLEDDLFFAQTDYNTALSHAERRFQFALEDGREERAFEQQMIQTQLGMDTQMINFMQQQKSFALQQEQFDFSKKQADRAFDFQAEQFDFTKSQAEWERWFKTTQAWIAQRNTELAQHYANLDLYSKILMESDPWNALDIVSKLQANPWSSLVDYGDWTYGITDVDWTEIFAWAGSAFITWNVSDVGTGRVTAYWTDANPYWLDVDGKIWDPILASFNGTVVDYWSDPSWYGNWVTVEDTSWNRTRYAHLNDVGVTTWDTITKWQMFATIGNTWFVIPWENWDWSHADITVRDTNWQRISPQKVEQYLNSGWSVSPQNQKDSLMDIAQSVILSSSTTQKWDNMAFVQSMIDQWKTDLAARHTKEIRKNNLPPAIIKEVDTWEQLKSQLIDFAFALDDFTQAWGDVGKIVKISEWVYEYAGKTTDEALNILDGRLDDFLDKFARSRTGAVVSKEEWAAFSRTLPTVWKDASVSQGDITAMIDNIDASTYEFLNTKFAESVSQGIGIDWYKTYFWALDKDISTTLRNLDYQNWEFSIRPVDTTTDIDFHVNNLPDIVSPTLYIEAIEQRIKEESQNQTPANQPSMSSNDPYTKDPYQRNIFWKI